MSDELPKPDQQNEPSVLDYVKSLFRSDSERIQLPDFVEEEPSAVGDQPVTVESQSGEVRSESIQHSSFSIHHSHTPFPWRSLLALLFALIGQNIFEPPPTNSPLGYAFYIAAFGFLGWAIYRGEWNSAPLAPTSEKTDPLTYRRLALFVSIVLSLLAFALFSRQSCLRSQM